MRKLLFLSMFTCALAISCSKQDTRTNQDVTPAANAPFTVEGRNGITVTASDVYSVKTSFRREIEIKDPQKNVSFPKLYLTFVSSGEENVYQQMKERPNTVNGEFTIETAGQVIYKRAIVNGKAQKGIKLPFRTASTEMAAPCTVTTVHDCVAWEIDDMNWIEYGACLVSAPGCYATLWASCTWEVCHNGKTYVNPN